MREMSSSYYPKLAFGNIKKNGKTYIPFLITSVLTVAMYYIIVSLTKNQGLNEIMGGSTLIYTLKLGSNIVAIFAVIFLFYTNSFLMKQRKKEFGLYSILGMEKKHISKMVAFETFFIAVTGLAIGL
ncbi:MAG: FtsX-like permease family protein, partial [Clostridiales bacterium]|nr:FtsX-like permease family protein [Clostridiales bacterium]